MAYTHKRAQKTFKCRYTFKGGAEYIYAKNEPPSAMLKFIGKSCPACTKSMVKGLSTHILQSEVFEMTRSSFHTTSE